MIIEHLRNGAYLYIDDKWESTDDSYYGTNMVKINGPGPEHLTFEQVRGAVHAECLCALKRQVIAEAN